MAAVDHMLAHHDRHASGDGNGNEAGSSVVATMMKKNRRKKEKLEKTQKRARSFSMIGVQADSLPLQPELDDGYRAAATTTFPPPGSLP